VEDLVGVDLEIRWCRTAAHRCPPLWSHIWCRRDPSARHSRTAPWCGRPDRTRSGWPDGSWPRSTRGRRWSSGVFRIDDPAAPPPRFGSLLAV